MDRKSAQELYSDYLDDELDEATARELEAFLETDAEARAEVDKLRKTLNSLSYLRSPAPEAHDIAHKVENRIARRSRGRFFGQGQQKLLWRIPFEWISFIIILLLLALYITSTGTRSVGSDPHVGSGSGTAAGSAKQAPGPPPPASQPKPTAPR